MSYKYSIVGAFSLLSLVACSSKDDAKPGTAPSNGTPDAGNPGTDSGGGAYPAPAPDSCITDVTPGKQSLECEGLKFELNVPETCLTAPCGFIVDVHGFGMTGPVEISHTKMPELAGAKGYIVIEPSAPAPAGGGLPAWAPANDDQVFAIMNHVIDVWHVDAKRIHFDGYSMGGWMTWRFVCKHSDILASAAPISAGSQPPGGSCAFTGDEMPAREIPILYTHGRTDGLVPYSTAETERDAVIAAWGFGAPESVEGGSDYQWDRYTNDNGTVFEFVQHDWKTSFSFPTKLNGHCFPAKPGFLTADAFLACDATSKFNWSERVLDFFVAHPMK
ncbi:MAG TPA: hypothetical protein VHE30_20840 [Polyangiaceae bacterium]|nr:hypothetical protein [Polyangiaceae bacterium]